MIQELPNQRVSADGFVDRDYKTDTEPYGAFLHFDSSAHFKKIDIQLQPESVIRGSVTDNSGEPIVGVTVSAVRQSDAIKNCLRPASSATTDSSGHFAIKNLPASVYLLSASGPNGYGDPPYATHWYQEKWFENAVTSDAATPITLGEHAVRSDVRITTRDEKRYRVIVWPSGPENASVPERYDVSILNRNTVEEGQKDGSWVIFDIPPGHYTLTSTAWSQVQYVGQGEQSFDVIDSDVTLWIHLGGLGEIAGLLIGFNRPKCCPNGYS